METIYAFKILLEKIEVKITILEKKIYINPQDKVNYLFNSSINGIEESDLIILIGCNPRHEGTILNARIRKSFVKNKTKIYSIGNPGDLTYDYTLLGDDLSDLKNIFEDKSKITQEIKNSKKPIFIVGESALELKNGSYIFEEMKNYLIKNKFISEDWNALNVLIQNASTVGALDLGLYNIDKDNNFPFFDKLEKIILNYYIL